MTIEDKQTKSQTKDKNNIEDAKSSQEYDNSIGYNGEKQLWILKLNVNY